MTFVNYFIFSCFDSPCGPCSTLWRHFEIKLRHTTVGRSLKEELPARSIHHYLTTNNKHAPDRIRTLNPSKQAAADTFDREATGIGIRKITDTNILCS